MARRPQAIQRSTLVPAARYDAAGGGRRLSKWTPGSVGPNKAITGLQKIRDRHRDAVRNDWAGESSVQKWTTALIGTGIVPRWKDRSLQPLWADFVRQADADGVLDLYGLQALSVRTWMDGGECFARRRPRRLDAPLSAPLQIQLLEPEMCPLLDATTWPGMPAGNEMRQGIELNRFGQRVAYWFYKSHPGDGTFGRTPAQDDLVRVTAANICHMYEPKRIGTLRGVSLLAPVLVRLRNSMDFEDAVLNRQMLANLFTMFVTKQLPDKWLGDLDINPLTGLPKMWEADGTMQVGLEPGVAMELKPGENVQFANPPEAGTTYGDYMRSTHLGTSAGGGLPYELMTGDIRDVSDRTLRVVINEFRRFAQQRQWHNVIPQMTQKWVEWWADALVLSGQLSPTRAVVAKRPVHSPHGWEYIHPVQDIEGKVKAIEAGLVSRDGVIGERGDDPVQIDEERRDSQVREKEMGIQQSVSKPPVSAKPQPPA